MVLIFLRSQESSVLTFNRLLSGYLLSYCANPVVHGSKYPDQKPYASSETRHRVECYNRYRLYR